MISPAITRNEAVAFVDVLRSLAQCPYGLELRVGYRVYPVGRLSLLERRGRFLFLVRGSAGLSVFDPVNRAAVFWCGSVPVVPSWEERRIA